MRLASTGVEVRNFEKIGVVYILQSLIELKIDTHTVFISGSALVISPAGALDVLLSSLRANRYQDRDQRRERNVWFGERRNDLGSHSITANLCSSPFSRLAPRLDWFLYEKIL